jgi:hypothetical protein
LLPHKKPRKSKKNPCPELTSEQKQTNRRLAKTRIIVEHAIGGMKHFSVWLIALETDQFH